MDAHAAVGRAARLQTIERVEDLSAALRRGGGQREPARARIGDDGHAVISAQPPEQHPQRRLHQRKLVFRAHRARHIDQKNQVRRRPRLRRDLAPLDADAHQPTLRRPRRRDHREIRRERLAVTRRRSRVAIGEIVDQLLDPHRILRRQGAVGERGADHRP